MIPSPTPDSPFWERKAIHRLTRAEWESLCDGCGRCCIIKLEDEDTDQIYYTDVVCHLMDMNTCRCTRYAERSRLVPTCLTLTPRMVKTLRWMPETCAYRLLAEGKLLAWWHPLVSADPNTIHTSGISVRGKVVPEDRVKPDELEDHVISEG